jgi:hypothetical protein
MPDEEDELQEEKTVRKKQEIQRGGLSGSHLLYK